MPRLNQIGRWHDDEEAMTCSREKRKKKFLISRYLACFAGSCFPCPAVAVFVLLAVVTSGFCEPPTIPIGYDAYRQWEKWPLQRIGMRTYMRSTCDRRGGNEGADA